ncbi:ATP-binding cassette domain-containing protein [Anaerocolumna sedimenticola]|uniref:ATP-binding cassette domain-containing protein n=1 Tax=Anaerocolumna sedimenticola TaxID=2696063 RepID=A0A6P1TP25_9FIRM|nr:ABC transporter ATP-binding protein [Anaerocolumna sedimenticola]QHQ61631.1 ATP-binding cassette domain-containing protein [Anaerocolumna sedimenticola]
MKSTNTNLEPETLGLTVKGAYKKKSFKRLMLLNLPHIKKIIIAAVCVLLVNTAMLVKPYILKIVIDDFLTKNTPQKGFYSLTGMGILYFAVVILGGFLNVIQINIINKAGQEILRTLRGQVFKTIQFLPLKFLDKTSSGSLITRATNDVEALSQLYTDVFMNFFRDVFLIIGIVLAMFIMDVRLTLVSFSVIPIMFLFIFLLRTKIKQNFRKMKTLIGRINGFMAENLSGMKLIQIFNGEKERKADFKELNDGYYKVTSFQVWMNSFLKPAANVFRNITVAILIWYGMDKISNQTLQIGILYAFTTYIQQFFEPISDLADNYTNIQSAFVSADRIFELLDQKENLEDLDQGISMERMDGDIEFKNVWFSYNEKDWILKDVSFTVPAGQTAAFVGQTGAGKTTIISLISGFYKIQKGEILINGININEIKRRDLRHNIAVVLQDVFLFSDTIGGNISLNDDIEPAVIEEAARASYAKEFVDGFPGKIHEPVMERGNTLSAGQRQLISFARAIAHDPAVIVLDEATANIDSQTEVLIQKAIENMAKNRTALIIAHRLSTIRNSDKIIVLAEGRIVESGNHEELMKKQGYYSNMVLEGRKFHKNKHDTKAWALNSYWLKKGIFKI